MRLGNHVKKVVARVNLAFIIQDGMFVELRRVHPLGDAGDKEGKKRKAQLCLGK